MRSLTLTLFSFLSLCSLLASPLTPSPQESHEIAQRLKHFVDSSDPSLMDVVPPKFELNRGRFVHPHSFLRGFEDAENPLLRAAGLKATEAFHQERCEHLIRNHFPDLDCNKPAPRRWATVEADDRVDDLVKTWMKKDEVVRSLDAIPTRGKTDLPLWSGSYWPMKNGGLSYRYATRKTFTTYKEAIAAYRQPQDWRGLANSLDLQRLGQKVLGWSPAEKYDLSVGDTNFTLTRQQKEVGQKAEDSDGKIPDWFGICDGWAAASIMVPSPMKVAEATGPHGVKVAWLPQDVRGLTSLQWSNGPAKFNHVGGRCSSEKLEIYPNGRLVQQDCFDTNPATFHLALANLVGSKHLSFAMDASFDAEVWNQPIYGYALRYFNPTDPDKKSTDWKEVAVKYDESFKEEDRFQKPLTRGKRVAREKWDDHGIKEVVGVIATVVYVDDRSMPHASRVADPDTFVRVSYTYDLELQEKDGKLVPTGGEWYQNAHPDFLWVPQKGSMPHIADVDDSLHYKPESTPEGNLTRYASAASEAGYPLCPVVSSLVSQSSGKDYHCPKD